MEPDNANVMSPEQDVEELTIEQCLLVHSKIAQTKKFFEAVTERLQTELLNGNKLPGVKLVESRKNRRYFDQSAAREVLVKTFGKAKVVEEKLISPAKLDDLMESKKMRLSTVEKINSLIEKPKGNPVVAADDDPRPEYVQIQETEFTNYGEVEDIL